MELYGKIRLASAECMSARSAASHFGISRDSVKKMLGYCLPPGHGRTATVKRPKFDGFAPIIDQWLIDDQGQNRKQRYAAERVFEQLHDEDGFTGG